MGKLTIGGIIILCVVIAFFASSVVATNDGGSNVIITYGQTTYGNQGYLNTVNSYFAQKGYSNLNNVNVEVIQASEVNAISQGISGKTYNSNEIFSSALVDLGGSNVLNVTVDTTKINLINAKMYASALESAGITQGKVFVTSPVSATGESALAGVMNCYEKATNTQIPEEVKQAANEEIYVQANVVNNSDASSDQVSQIVDDVKDEVQSQNITDYQSILDVVNQTVEKYNIPLSSQDMESIAKAIFDTFSVNDKANDYKEQLITATQNL